MSLEKVLKKGKNFFKKAAIISSFVALPFLYSSCEKDNLEEPRKNENPNLYENTLPFSQNMLNNISSYDKGTFIFSSPQENISEGDIIVGGISNETPYGFLRKVDAVYNDGKTLKTSQATLEEAVKNGTIIFNKQFRYSDVKLSKGTTNYPEKAFLEKSSSGGFDFHLYFNYPIYDKDNNYSTTDDQIILNSDLYFNLATDGQFIFKEGNTKVEFRVIYDSKFDLSLNSKTALPYNKKIEVWKAYFTPFVITTPVPVVVLPKFSVNLGIGGEVSASVKTGITEDFYSSVTLEYDGKWSTSKETNKTFKFVTPSLNLNENIKAYAEAELELLLYGITGPHGSVEAYLILDANLTKNPWWTLSAGLEGKVGFETEILSKGIFGFETTVFNIKEKIADAGGPFIQLNNPPEAYFTITPSSGTTSTTFEFDASESKDVEDGFNLQYRWDWENDGTWDKNYSSQKTQNHQFNNPGNYAVKLEVKDSKGLTDILTKDVLVGDINLNEIIIQPGPEGKDAWVRRDWYCNSSQYPDYYSSSGNDSVLEIIYDSQGCSGINERALLEFTLNQISSTTKISSAQFKVYGYATINTSGEIPTLSLYKLTSPWNESNVSWENQPERKKISDLDFVPKGTNSWHTWDVTSVIQDWVSGESNFGFGISAAENRVWSEIYSSDHPDAEKRPKLIISYYE